MSSVAIEFKDVTKQFNNASSNAVDHVSFSVNEGEMITILGTSGCGKTTLMKMVNRLYEPTSGEIDIFGENIADKDPIQLRRQIGYVIQQVGLFPHMTVEKNISVVPEILGWDQQRIDDFRCTHIGRHISEILHIIPVNRCKLPSLFGENMNPIRPELRPDGRLAEAGQKIDGADDRDAEHDQH